MGRFDRERPDAGVAGRDDDECSCTQMLFDLSKGSQQQLSLRLRSVRSATDEDHAGRGLVRERQETAEIRVDCDQHTVLRPCRGHHVDVKGSQQTAITDVDGVAPGVSQQLCNSARERFIDEEPHPTGRSGSSRSSTAAAAY